MNKTKKSRNGDTGAYHHGDLKNALIDSAVSILEKEGLQGLTLRKAAARAGVSHSAPYRHFPSKEALIAEISRMGFEDLGRRGKQYIQNKRNAGERLRAYGLAYVEFASEKPTHFKIMFGQSEIDHSTYPDLQRTARATFQLLVDLVEECQEAGVFRKGDPGKMAAANWAYVHGLAHLLVDQKLDWLVEQKNPSDRARELWKKMDLLLMDGLHG